MTHRMDRYNRWWVARPPGVALTITALALTTLALTTLAMTGCGSDALTPYSAKPMDLGVLSSVRLRDDGAGKLTLAMATASVSGTISTAATVGCTANLTVKTAAADGSCAMTLTFGPRTDGPGMALTAATLVARSGATSCSPLAGRLPATKADVIYALSGGNAWLPWVEPESADAVSGELAMKKVLIELRGEAKLTAGKDVLTLENQGLQLGGDLILQADAATACAPCTKKECKSPYPQIRLRDAQPKSVAHNLEYTLDRWLGQFVVVTLSQGW